MALGASPRRLLSQLIYISSSAGRSAGCVAAAAAGGPHSAAAVASAAKSTATRCAIFHNSRGAWGWQQTSFSRFQSTAASLQQLLDGVSATQLRDALTDEAELRSFMTYPELIQFIIQQKAAASESEAQERADALAKAGVVLRFNGMVYLRPQEVSEVVFKLLPTDRQTAEHNLAQVEQEIEQMSKQHRQIYAYAQRWPRRWLFAGCAALATQLFGFAYLTWWELSWDVMEPIAYMVSLSYSLIAYMYFLYTRGSYFEQKDFKEYWENQLMEKRMAAAGFDIDKYQHLMRTRERVKRYLALQPHLSNKQHNVGEQQQQQPSQVDAGEKLKAA